jgi:hypothetical protein
MAEEPGVTTPASFQLAGQAAATTGARITADPTTTPIAISLAPTTPALPTGLVRSPSVRLLSLEPSAAVLGHLLLAADPGHGLPLVALMPQWRQDHPNKRPPSRATAISAMGHEPPPALQKKDRGWCLVVASFQSVFLALRSQYL